MDGRPRWARASALAPVAVLALVLYLVRLPYFAMAPGPTRDVIPLIRIERHPVYPPRGHLLLTSVHLDQANAYQALWAWLEPSVALVPERDVLEPGETPSEEMERAASQMDTSKIDAAVVALTRYAGYPRRHGRGVLVESVVPGTPADGKLAAGDVILSVDRVPVDDVDQLGRMIRAAGVGRPLALQVRAGSRTRVVRLTPVRVRGIDHPVIGVSSVATFPFPLSIQSDGIGGPSAGLMWTLGLVDLLTPGDLTGGTTVAGTGTIAPDGTVGPVGGVAQKVVAAERAGARIFFVPVQEAAEARAAARGMTVVPVRTYLDAVRYLEAHR
jgi:PDZ domain-containing protein